MDEYLAHHGVKKQKWGIRRYQNKDGTLTAMGRARLGLSPTPRKNKGSSESNQENNRTESNQQQRSSEKSEAKTQKQKVDIDKLTTDELRNLVQREEMKQKYAKLTATPESKKKVSLGKEVATKILKDSVTNVGTQFASYVMRETINKAYGKDIFKKDN